MQDAGQSSLPTSDVIAAQVLHYGDAQHLRARHLRRHGLSVVLLKPVKLFLPSFRRLIQIKGVDKVCRWQQQLGAPKAHIKMTLEMRM